MQTITDTQINDLQDLDDKITQWLQGNMLAKLEKDFQNMESQGEQLRSLFERPVNPSRPDEYFCL